jgi:hypothetical protein
MPLVNLKTTMISSYSIEGIKVEPWLWYSWPSPFDGLVVSGAPSSLSELSKTYYGHCEPAPTSAP